MASGPGVLTLVGADFALWVTAACLDGFFARAFARAEGLVGAGTFPFLVGVAVGFDTFSLGGMMRVGNLDRISTPFPSRQCVVPTRIELVGAGGVDSAYVRVPQQHSTRSLEKHMFCLQSAGHSVGAIRISIL